MQRAVCVAMLAGFIFSAGANTEEYTWTSNSSGTLNWSQASWSPVVPAAGGGTNLTLTFSGDSGKFNAVNDLAGLFVLNRLIFTAGIPTLSGNGLAFAVNEGQLPCIDVSSTGAATISAPLELRSDTGIAGTKAVTLSGAITGTGGLVLSNLTGVVISGDNSFCGDTYVRTGTCTFVTDHALGKGELFVTNYNASAVSISGGINITNSIHLGSEAARQYSPVLYSQNGSNVLSGEIRVATSQIRCNSGTLEMKGGCTGNQLSLSAFSSETIIIDEKPLVFTDYFYPGGNNTSTIILSSTGNVFNVISAWGGVKVKMGGANVLPPNVCLSGNDKNAGRYDLNGYNQTVGSQYRATPFFFKMTNSAPGTVPVLMINQTGNGVSMMQASGNLDILKKGTGTLTVSDQFCSAKDFILAEGTVSTETNYAFTAPSRIAVETNGTLSMNGTTQACSVLVLGGGTVQDGMIYAQTNLLLSGTCAASLCGDVILKEGAGTTFLTKALASSGQQMQESHTIDVKKGALVLGKMGEGVSMYYSFNDTNTFLQDASTNAVTLTPTEGIPVWSADGKFGGSLYLNGSTRLGSASGTFPASIPTGATPYTVSAYVKANTNCYIKGGWIGYGNTATARSNNFRLLEANPFRSVWNYWYASDFGATLPSGTFTDDWHIVTGTWDGTTRRIYMDGVSVAVNSPSVKINAGTNCFVVGATIADVAFTGWIDDLLVMSRAISAAEAKNLYQNGVLQGSFLGTNVSLNIDAEALVSMVMLTNETVRTLSGCGTVYCDTLSVVESLRGGDADSGMGVLTVHGNLILNDGIKLLTAGTATGCCKTIVKGTVAFSGGGTVALLGTKIPKNFEWPILSADSFVNSAILGSWKISGIPKGCKAKLSLRNGTLYLKSSASGFVVMLK